MDELAEYWKAEKQEYRKRREIRKARNVEKINGAGLDCTWRDDNMVARLETKHGAVDFWPSHGKWHFTKTQKRGKGFENLMRAIKEAVK